jgi:glycosyltransferase involved in cell wall biosynthesis
MRKMEKVSIIMPIFNGSKYLKDSINSIINQTYKNWELIIVIDYGSNDNSLNIINSFYDLRIVTIQNKLRMGIAESINIGIKNSSGKYIARMDADDISGINRLELQVKYLEENKDIGLCGIVPEFFGEQKIHWNIETDPIKIKHNIFFYTPCVHPSIMFRRNIIEKNNIYYDKSFKATEDYDFFSKIIGVTKISNINNNRLFKYRMSKSNATNERKQLGLDLYDKVMYNSFKNYLNLEFNKEEISLLDSNKSIIGYHESELYNKIVELDLLLKKILYASYVSKNYDFKEMFLTLHKRWMELTWTITSEDKLYNNGIIIFIIKHSIFYNNTLDYIQTTKILDPRVSIILPVYNGENYIIDSVLSILKQTYINYELLIIIEYGTNDNTINYLKMFNDSRIKIIVNKKKLGLAESLNYGILISKGIYIARMDADDLSLPNRLKEEVKFLDKNKDYGLVCSWQRHFGPNGTIVQMTKTSYNDLKASLLFTCDICHSTVMLRKDILIKNNLFYDSNMAMEDYDLWNRLLEKSKLASLKKILGEYREHENNITNSKKEEVIKCEQEIVSRNLKKLNINVTTCDRKLLTGWENIYINNISLTNKEIKLLNEIYLQNKIFKVYNHKSLKKIINRRKNWVLGKSDNVDIKYERQLIIMKLKYIIKKYKKMSNKGKEK